MSRKPQNPNGKGSLKWMQKVVNEKPELLNDMILQNLAKRLKGKSICWKSPRQDDEYAEYIDDDFIARVNLNPEEIMLSDFWPKRGANWDGLAVTDKGDIILVEAKANIPEMVSSPTGAGVKSLERIQDSMNKTKEFLNKDSSIVDWTGKFYQYTNRIAHLYFLREVKKKNVFLVNIYFVGDDEVNGPTTVAEWKGAIQVMQSYLELSSHKLKKYMADIFIDVQDLKD